MNKELKEAVGRSIWASLEDDFLNTNSSKVDAKSYLHTKLLSAVMKSLQEKLDTSEKLPTSSVEKEIDSLISDWYYYAGYLHTSSASTAFLKTSITELLSRHVPVQTQETAKQETFTARSARSAVRKARTCEGFIQIILDDIKYRAECGITECKVSALWNTYKYDYISELAEALRELGFDVEFLSKTRDGQNRKELLIRW